MSENERPQIDSEADLHAFLSKTVATEAFDTIEKEHPVVRYQAPVMEDEEQPEPEAKQADPAPKGVDAQPSPPAGLPEGQRKLLANKYETVEDFEKGYYELLNLNKRVLQENDTLKTKPEVQRADPAARAESREPRDILAKLEDLGIDPEVMGEAIRVISEQAIDSRLRPRDAMAEAETYMQRSYPEAQRFGEEVAQYVQADPNIRDFVQRAWSRGDYKDAMELAWLRFDMTRKGHAEAGIKEEAAQVKEQIAVQKTDGALITTQKSSVHPPKDAPMSQGRFDKLVEASRAGYPEFLLRETIGKSLPDELFS